MKQEGPHIVQQKTPDGRWVQIPGGILYGSKFSAERAIECVFHDADPAGVYRAVPAMVSVGSAN